MLSFAISPGSRTCPTGFFFATFNASSQSVVPTTLAENMAQMLLPTPLRTSKTTGTSSLGFLSSFTYYDCEHFKYFSYSPENGGYYAVNCWPVGLRRSSCNFRSAAVGTRPRLGSLPSSKSKPHSRRRASLCGPMCGANRYGVRRQILHGKLGPLWLAATSLALMTCSRTWHSAIRTS